MTQALSFIGSTIDTRWHAAKAWMRVAKREDATFHVSSCATLPASSSTEPSLSIEFDARFVEGDEYML